MRPELFHPMIVHFPLALLLTGSALRLGHFFLRKHRFGQAALFFSWLVLLLGIVCAWLAVFAGEIAEDIVKPQLCEPDMLEEHKDLAYSTAILFTAALALDFMKTWIRVPRLRLIITTAFSILYLVASLLLILTGGFGADLVYEQGAAVEKLCD